MESMTYHLIEDEDDYNDDDYEDDDYDDEGDYDDLEDLVDELEKELDDECKDFIDIEEKH